MAPGEALGVMGTGLSSGRDKIKINISSIGLLAQLRLRARFFFNRRGHREREWRGEEINSFDKLG